MKRRLTSYGHNRKDDEMTFNDIGELLLGAGCVLALVSFAVLVHGTLTYMVVAYSLLFLGFLLALLGMYMRLLWIPLEKQLANGRR